MNNQKNDTECYLTALHVNAMIGSVAGGMAHFLNNVLSGMLGFVTLAPTLQPSSLQVLAEPIKEQIKDLSRLASLIHIAARKPEESDPISTCELTSVTQDTLLLARTLLPRTVKITSEIPECSSWAAISPETYVHLLLGFIFLGTHQSPSDTTLHVKIDGNQGHVILESSTLKPPSMERGQLLSFLTKGMCNTSLLTWIALENVITRAGGSLTCQQVADSLWRITLGLPLGSDSVNLP